MLSIVIPTYKEADNIPELINRITAIQLTQPFEVLIADDDSQDGTIEAIDTLKQHYSWLKLITIKNSRSLSRAVMTGIQCAQYPVIIIMDADLSHPPEKIPEMMAMLSQPNVDMVIGSRYINGGSVDDSWSIARKIISRFCASLAGLIVSVRDPLSGFIAFNKQIINKNILDPIGWKIGLEIMVKCDCKNIKEIPIHFADRKFGDSKLNAKEAVNYFRHLRRLIVYKYF